MIEAVATGAMWCPEANRRERLFRLPGAGSAIEADSQLITAQRRDFCDNGAFN